MNTHQLPLFYFSARNISLIDAHSIKISISEHFNILYCHIRPSGGNA